MMTILFSSNNVLVLTNGLATVEVEKGEREFVKGSFALTKPEGNRKLETDLVLCSENFKACMSYEAALAKNQYEADVRAKILSKKADRLEAFCDLLENSKDWMLHCYNGCMRPFSGKRMKERMQCFDYLKSFPELAKLGNTSCSTFDPEKECKLVMKMLGDRVVNHTEAPTQPSTHPIECPSGRTDVPVRIILSIIIVVTVLLVFVGTLAYWKGVDSNNPNKYLKNPETNDQVQEELFQEAPVSHVAPGTCLQQAERQNHLTAV